MFVEPRLQAAQLEQLLEVDGAMQAAVKTTRVKFSGASSAGLKLPLASVGTGSSGTDWRGISMRISGWQGQLRLRGRADTCLTLQSSHSVDVGKPPVHGAVVVERPVLVVAAAVAVRIGELPDASLQAARAVRVVHHKGRRATQKVRASVDLPMERLRGDPRFG